MKTKLLKVFSTVSVVMILVLFGVSGVVAQDTLHIPSTPGTVQAIYWPIINWATEDVVYELITAEDIWAAGGTDGQDILAWGMQWHSASTGVANNFMNNYGTYPRVRVHFANMPSDYTVLPGGGNYTTFGNLAAGEGYDWQLVYSRDVWNPELALQEQGSNGTVYNAGDWCYIVFDEPFEYTGGAVMTRWYIGNYVNSLSGTGSGSATQLAGTGAVPWRRGTATGAPVGTGPYIYEHYSWMTDRSSPTLYTGYSGGYAYQVKSNFRLVMSYPCGQDTLLGMLPAVGNYYAGNPLGLDQHPSISYYKELPDICENNYFSYVITRMSDNEVVYRAKSGSGVGDTLLHPSGYGSVMSYSIPSAVGVMAGNAGEFLLNTDPLPSPGTYRITVRWYRQPGRLALYSRSQDLVVQEGVPIYYSLSPSLLDGYVVQGQPLSSNQHPGVRYMRLSPDITPVINYSILDSGGDTVYRAQDERTGSYDIVLDQGSLAVQGTKYFSMSSGLYSMPSGGSSGLLNTGSMPVGWYYVHIYWDDGITYPRLLRDSFYVFYEYDLSLVNVSTPGTYLEDGGILLDSSMSNGYVLGSSWPFEYVVENRGVHPILSFDVSLTVRVKNSGSVVFDTVYRYENLAVPIQPSATRLIYTPFEFNTLDVGLGDYTIEVSLVPVDPVNMESVFDNNRFPLLSSHVRYFTIRQPYVVGSTSLLDVPKFRYPYRPLYRIASTGTEEINGVPSRLTVTYNGDRVFYEEKLIDNIPLSGVDSFSFNNWFLPREVGSYVFLFEYLLPDALDWSSYSTTVSIGSGLRGVYTVGSSGTYKSLQSAVDALYISGIDSSGVVFELLDDYYLVEGGLDLRSRIAGAGEGTNARITFRPSLERLSDQSPIVIEVVNSLGWGIAIGQSLRTNNLLAAVNVTSDILDRRYLANSLGYITFDGGSRRNIEVRVRDILNSNGKGFSAPFYLCGGASHIEIKNCRLVGTEASAVESVDLPIITYYESTREFSFAPDYLVDGFDTRAYSAGVVIRNQVSPSFRMNNNTYTADILTSGNNIISGNIIDNFGYGVVLFGMGANVVDQSYLVSNYNFNDSIVGNYIHNVSGAGIFLGFTEGAVVSKNRINNVRGINGHNLLTAGVLLGYNVLDVSMLDGHDLSYNNINPLIEKNEIDYVRSDVSSNGIFVTEPSNTLLLLGRTFDLSALGSRYEITNNIISNILSYTNMYIDRSAISLSPSRSSFDASLHRISSVAVTNNTIILSDGVSSLIDTVYASDWGADAIGGIVAYDVDNLDIYNNAIYLSIDPLTRYNNIAPLILRSRNPNELDSSININYNSYFVSGLWDSSIASSQHLGLVRFYQLDRYNRLLDGGGFSTEYSTLRNWTNWTGMDKNSVFYDFVKDMERRSYHMTPDIGGTYDIYRMKSTVYDTVSLLDMGHRFDYVSTDIDDVGRLVTGKVFTIGAIEFYSKHLVNDFEVKSITSPAAYLNSSKFSEEQVMIRKGSNIAVRAIVRNNGQLYLSGLPVVCTVTYPGGTFSESLNISLAVGEEREIAFFISNSSSLFEPTPYSEIPLAAPLEYSTMSTTATPVYTIEVSLDGSYANSVGDENSTNNSQAVDVRFFVPRSELGLLITAEHSYSNLYGLVNNESVAIESNQDIVAGRLNFDTLVAALNKLSFYQTVSEDGTHHFDVFERTVWEPRSVDYTIYNAVMWADGHDKPLTYWEMRSLFNYANAATSQHKKSFIAASQELLSSNLERLNLFNLEFQDNIIRANQPVRYTFNPLTIKGLDQNYNYTIDISETGYHTNNSDAGTGLVDASPQNYSFQLTDTSYGQNFIAYYWHDGNNTAIKDTNSIIAAVTAKMVERNVVYTTIDWRHLMNAAAFINGILNDIGKDFTDIEQTLSLNITHFDAAAINNKVALSWSTDIKNNISSFDIEKAPIQNAITGSFNKIANKQSELFNTNYNLLDANVNFGNKYAYRLKINDFNGNYIYSDIKEVSIEMINGLYFTPAMPNPATNFTKVEYSLNANSNILITLNDITGTELRKIVDDNISSGKHTINIDTENLPAGTYYIVFFVNGQKMEKINSFTIAK